MQQQLYLQYEQTVARQLLHQPVNRPHAHLHLAHVHRRGLAPALAQAASTDDDSGPRSRCCLVVGKCSSTQYVVWRPGRSIGLVGRRLQCLVDSDGVAFSAVVGVAIFCL